eukprot:gene2093-18149_t
MSADSSCNSVQAPQQGLYKGTEHARPAKGSANYRDLSLSFPPTVLLLPFLSLSHSTWELLLRTFSGACLLAATRASIVAPCDNNEAESAPLVSGERADCPPFIMLRGVDEHVNSPVRRSAFATNNDAFSGDLIGLAGSDDDNKSVSSSGPSRASSAQPLTPELIAIINAQVAFYFSDINLPTDIKFLRQIMKDPQGFDQSLVALALRHSKELVLSECRTRVRRAIPVPDYDVAAIQRRTILVEYLLEFPTIELVSNAFSAFGPVNLVRICSKDNVKKLPRWLTDSCSNTNLVHAYVEYESEASVDLAVENALEMDSFIKGLKVSRLRVTEGGMLSHRSSGCSSVSSRRSTQDFVGSRRSARDVDNSMRRSMQELPSTSHAQRSSAVYTPIKDHADSLHSHFSHGRASSMTIDRRLSAFNTQEYASPASPSSRLMPLPPGFTSPLMFVSKASANDEGVDKGGPAVSRVLKTRTSALSQQLSFAMEVKLDILTPVKSIITNEPGSTAQRTPIAAAVAASPVPTSVLTVKKPPLPKGRRTSMLDSEVGADLGEILKQRLAAESGISSEEEVVVNTCEEERKRGAASSGVATEEAANKPKKKNRRRSGSRRQSVDTAGGMSGGGSAAGTPPSSAARPAVAHAGHAPSRHPPAPQAAPPVPASPRPGLAPALRSRQPARKRPHGNARPLSSTSAPRPYRKRPRLRDANAAAPSWEDGSKPLHRHTLGPKHARATEGSSFKVGSAEKSRAGRTPGTQDSKGQQEVGSLKVGSVEKSRAGRTPRTQDSRGQPEGSSFKVGSTEKARSGLAEKSKGSTEKSKKPAKKDYASWAAVGHGEHLVHMARGPDSVGGFAPGAGRGRGMPPPPR